MRVRIVLSSLLAIAAFGLATAPEAQASHFRYGTLQWAPTTTLGEVRFDLRVALRRDSSAYGFFPGGVDNFAETGDIINEGVGGTGLSFGDGGVTGQLQFIVTDFSVSENWIVALALHPGTTSEGVLHTYSGSGPYTAMVSNGASQGCCRLGSAQLANRSDDPYPLSTIVRPRDGNRSPISGLVPIVVVPESATATFLVPATDPDGDRTQFRMSTNAEAGGGPHPGNSITVNAGTGLVTWNNVGRDKTRFWTTQVVIEDLDANGVVKTKTPVDFLLKIVPQTGGLPSCALTPAGPFVVAPGTPLGFTVTATDPDAGETLILNSTGVPSGAAMNPPLPTTGPSPLTSQFSWTPTAGEAGPHQVSFSAVDAAGQQGLCSAEILVVVNTAPTVTCPGRAMLQCAGPNGTPHTLTAHVEDEDGDALEVIWKVNGVAVETDNVPAGGGGGTSADVTLIRNWPLGTSNVVVEVSDGEAPVASCTTSVTVVDTTAPVVTCSVQNGLLWPPNHKMINVGLVATANDSCTRGGPAQVAVWGDEDDEMPTGDGNHSPDALDIASGTLRLRAERRGDADGRVYLVIAKSMDGGGNVGTACCTVVTPHSMNPRSRDLVLAQAAAAKATCEATGAAPADYYVVGDGAPQGPHQVTTQSGGNAKRSSGARARTGRAAEGDGQRRRRQ
jgi:hypothetical protein